MFGRPLRLVTAGLVAALATAASATAASACYGYAGCGPVYVPPVAYSSCGGCGAAYVVPTISYAPAPCGTCGAAYAAYGPALRVDLGPTYTYSVASEVEPVGEYGAFRGYPYVSRHWGWRHGWGHRVGYGPRFGFRGFHRHFR